MVVGKSCVESVSRLNTSVFIGKVVKPSIFFVCSTLKLSSKYLLL